MLATELLPKLLRPIEYQLPTALRTILSLLTVRLTEVSKLSFSFGALPQFNS
jgi:hypothetical protein